MKKGRWTLLLVGILACSCTAALPTSVAAQIAIRADGTSKLSPELNATFLARGTMLGITEDGEAVIRTEADSDSIRAIVGIDSVYSVGVDAFEQVEEYLVLFSEGDAEGARSAVQDAGLSVNESYGEFETDANFLVVRAPSGINSEQINSIASATAVVYMEPNYKVHIPPIEELESLGVEGRAEPGNGFDPDETVLKTPDDPDYPKLWGMPNARAPKAWDHVTDSGSRVVCVIDTGIDFKHPDLAGNMWSNPKEQPNGKDDDGNGLVDDIHGARFLGSTRDGNPMDDNGHGTHVAGTIGAVGNNKRQVVGVNWKTKLMACKFLAKSGSGSTADAIYCVDYASKMGASLINASWGGGGASKALEDAIKRAQDKGVLFVAAAGNSGADNDSKPHYPSSYPQDNIIAVAAIDNSEKKASFSCYGKRSVDVAAPGAGILSTWPGGGTNSISGTSMATPHVAGAVALIWNHPTYKSANWKQVKEAVLKNARKLSDLKGKIGTEATLDLSFLGGAPPTVGPAFTHFDRADIKQNSSIAKVTFELKDTTYVHLRAQTTAQLIKPTAGKVSVTSGLYTQANPNAIYTDSRRDALFEGGNDKEPLLSAMVLRLPKGTHTVYWNIWIPKSAQLQTQGGLLIAEIFDPRARITGEMLEAEDLGILNVTEDGVILGTIEMTETVGNVEIIGE